MPEFDVVNLVAISIFSNEVLSPNSRQIETAFLSYVPSVRWKINHFRKCVLYQLFQSKYCACLSIWRMHPCQSSNTGNPNNNQALIQRFQTSEVSDHLWRVGTRQFHGISSYQCYPSFKCTFTLRLFSSQLPLFVGFCVLFVSIGFPSTAASSNSTLDGVSVRSPRARGQTPMWAVSSSQIIYTRAPAGFGCKRSGSVESYSGLLSF